MFTTRLIVGLPVAAAITFGLFVLMRGLIADVDEIEQEVYPERGIIILGRQVDDTPTVPTDLKPIEEPPTEALPPPIKPVPAIPTDGEEGEPTFGPIEPDFKNPGRDVCGQPIVRVAPSYPRRAADQGIEGYAVVEFTVTTEGTIKNTVVVEQEPGTVFGSAAKRAVEKWRYAPCEINGKVKEVRLRVWLTFELDNS